MTDRAVPVRHSSMVGSHARNIHATDIPLLRDHVFMQSVALDKGDDQSHDNESISNTREVRGTSSRDDQVRPPIMQQPSNGIRVNWRRFVGFRDSTPPKVKGADGQQQQRQRQRRRRPDPALSDMLPLPGSDLARVMMDAIDHKDREISAKMVTVTNKSEARRLRCYRCCLTDAKCCIRVVLALVALAVAGLGSHHVYFHTSRQMRDLMSLNTDQQQRDTLDGMERKLQTERETYRALIRSTMQDHLNRSHAYVHYPRQRNEQYRQSQRINDTITDANISNIDITKEDRVIEVQPTEGSRNVMPTTAQISRPEPPLLLSAPPLVEHAAPSDMFDDTGPIPTDPDTSSATTMPQRSNSERYMYAAVTFPTVGANAGVVNLAVMDGAQSERRLNERKKHHHKKDRVKHDTSTLSAISQSLPDLLRSDVAKTIRK